MDAQDLKYKESSIDVMTSSTLRSIAQARSNSLADDVIGVTTPRRSAASSVSSNTTSGIASDKLQTSIDENDGAYYAVMTSYTTIFHKVVMCVLNFF